MVLFRLKMEMKLEKSQLPKSWEMSVVSAAVLMSANEASSAVHVNEIEQGNAPLSTSTI